jgi:hypothetical protein
MSTSALPEPLERIVAAINAGDTPGFLACFAADGLVNDWGRTFVGPDKIKAWSDGELIGARGHLTVNNSEETAGRFVLHGHWASRVFTGDSAFAFVLNDGLIKEMHITG